MGLLRRDAWVPLKKAGSRDDVRLCRDAWVPLSKPVRVMTFDLYEAEAHMQPAEVELCIPVHTQGVCNAIAFWFELFLDENTSLSTSPYAEKVSLPSSVVQGTIRHCFHSGNIFFFGFRVFRVPSASLVLSQGTLTSLQWAQFHARDADGGKSDQDLPYWH